MELVAYFDLWLHHMDVKATFLNDLDAYSCWLKVLFLERVLNKPLHLLQPWR